MCPVGHSQPCWQPGPSNYKRVVSISLGGCRLGTPDWLGLDLPVTSQHAIFNYVETSKLNFWCAVSTHPGEEELIFKSHLKIKERGINVKTIIIPRHINRSQKIYNIANDFKLKSQTKPSTNKKPQMQSFPTLR